MSASQDYTAGLQVYFVDASLPGYQGLMSGLGEGSKVFVIENTSDAFAQMDAALRTLTDPVAALHVYSHGREGAIFLGGQWIDEAALTNGKANTLSSIGNYLTEDGDILLYGCYTGAGVVGESFMAQLARLTRADVAASNNLTGLGGDWVLENRTGPIESGFTKPQDWLGMLAPGQNINGMGVIEGTKDDDTITGFVTNDIIYGHGGKDTMYGKDGNDAYIINGNDAFDPTKNTQVIELANEGIDTVYSRVANFDLSAGTAAGAVFNSAVEYIVLENPAGSGLVAQHAKGNNYSQTLVGNALSNNLVGGGGHDVLYGYDGDDFLDGGSGEQSLAAGEVNERNTLIGGKGNDNYIVRSKLDQVVENRNEGTDHVYSFVDYALSTNLENLTLLDGPAGQETMWAKNATGNEQNNVLRGNSAANYLSGLAGNDTLYGSKDGEVGDTLDGGAGNDAYYIYNADASLKPLDTIIELANGGIDSVYSTVDYTLGAHLENLYLMDTATKGTGNTQNNYIRGNEDTGSVLDGAAGTNTLAGGYGNDTFIVRSAGDSILDAGGDANVVQSHVTFNATKFTNAKLQTIELKGIDNIHATAQLNVATTLRGNDGNNILTGGDQGDVLYDAGNGADTLAGGKGDDKYYVTKASTVIQETAAGTAGGIDSVYVGTGVDYTLGGNVENLYMGVGVAATAGQRGMGNTLANVIDASAITDSLKGVILMGGGPNAAGEKGDTLIGGAGNDQLYSYNNYDVIDGGAGQNVLYINYSVAGGDAEGFDWNAYFKGVNAKVDNIAKVVYNYVGEDTSKGVSIDGSSLATNLVGTARNDTLMAYGHNDAAVTVGSTLDGGAGADYMKGASVTGTMFYVDDSSTKTGGDTAIGGTGIDTIRSTVSIDLSDNRYTSIEVVELLNSPTALTAKADSAVTVNTGLYGNTGNNILTGYGGNDTLDGRGGNNTLVGGAGNDVYVIRSTGDKVVDSGGTNIIYTHGININLGSTTQVSLSNATIGRVENLDSVKGVTLTGTTGGEYLSGYNNATSVTVGGSDVIDGKGGADSIYGGGGGDVIYYYGDEAVVDGGAGFDKLLVQASVTSVDGAKVNLDSFEHIEMATTTAASASVTTTITAGITRLDGIMITGNTAKQVITGSDQGDKIYGGGGADTIDAGKGNDFVEIGFNSSTIVGGSAIIVDGGEGTDTLSFGKDADKIVFDAEGGISHYNHATLTAPANTSHLRVNGFEFYTGGGGNDTLDASKSAVGMFMSGGLGNDSIIGSDKGDIILLDGGNDTVNLGAGNDILTLSTAAIGATIVVNKFNAHMDSIDDSALGAGWTKTPTQTNPTTTTIVWTQTGTTNKITMTLNGVIASELEKSFVQQVIVGTSNTLDVSTSNTPYIIHANSDTLNGNTITAGNASDTVYGGAGADKIDGGRGNDNIMGGGGADTISGGEGQDHIYLKGSAAGASVSGGAGDDTIIVDTLAAGAKIYGDSIAGSTVSGNDLILINAVSSGGGDVSIDGGWGVDTLAFGAAASVTFSATSSTDIAMGNQTLTGVSVSGIDFYQGSAGNDYIDASLKAVGLPLAYHTGGGADTVIGSASDDIITALAADSGMVSISSGKGDDIIRIAVGASSIVVNAGDDNDIVYLDRLITDRSRVTLDGGAGTDMVHLGDNRIGLTLAANGSVVSLTANGAAMDSVSITNFEGYGGGAGNDTFSASSITAGTHLTLDGGAGNDSIYVGAIASAANVKLDGGAGIDTLYLNSAVAGQGQKLVLYSAGTDKLTYYAVANPLTTTATNTTISGFEYFKGNNAGNYFDARLYEATPVTLEGGAGNDTLQVYRGQLIGGAGEDLLVLKDVKGGVSASGGAGKDTNFSFSDTLRFENTEAMRATLNAANFDYNASVTGNIFTSLGYMTGTVQTNVTANATGIEAIEFGSGNDIISVSGTGAYQIDAGAGNDNVTVGSIAGHVMIDGGDGNDTINVGTITAGASYMVNIRGGAHNDFDSTVKNNNVINITSITGNGMVDIFGDGGAPGGGADTITVGTISGGNVHIEGGQGTDSLTVTSISGGTVGIFGGGDGANDTITVGTISGGTVTLNGGAGADSISIGAVIGASGNPPYPNDSVIINAGAGNDTIRLDSVSRGGTYMNGEAGNDVFYLGNIGGNASYTTVNVNGGADTDSLYLNGSVAANMSISGSGNATIIMNNNATESIKTRIYASDIEYYHGSSVNDTITVGNITKAITISGGAGADSIDASAAAIGMNIYGGAGNDTIKGSNYGDVIYLDGGNDSIVLGTGAATDVLTMMTSAAGGSSTVSGFSATNDWIDEQALLDAGWKRTESGATNAVITWKKTGSSDIVVTLMGVAAADVKFEKRNAHLVDASNIFDATTDANTAWSVTANNNGNSIIGGSKADIIHGGTGADQVYGRGGNDYLYWNTVSAGASTLTLNGTETVTVPGVRGYGEDGNDTLSVGSVTTTGRLTLDGGAGNDSIYVGNVGLLATVSLNGGAGVDTLYLNNTASTTAVMNDGSNDYTVTVHSGQHVSLDAGGAGTLGYYDVIDYWPNGTVTATGTTLSGFEYLKGNDFGNNFNASAYAGAMTLEGGAGSDILTGGKGHRLIGGEGSDLLVLKDVTGGVNVDGGAGYDTLQFGNSEAMRATLNAANFGNDTASIFTSLGYGSGTTVMATSLVSATGIEAIEFGSGNDIISVSGVGTYRVDAGGGADTVTVATANVTTKYAAHVYGGAGADNISFGNLTFAGTTLGLFTDVFVDGGADNDTINFGTLALNGAVDSSMGPHTHIDIKGGVGADSIYVASVTGKGDFKVYGDGSGASDGNDTITIGTIAGERVTYAGGWPIYELDACINGGGGNDSISVGTFTGGNVSIEGGDGNDTITVSTISGATAKTLYIDGGDGNDRITIGNVSVGTSVTINGGAGSDIISTGTISGGTVVLSGGYMMSDSLTTNTITTGAISAGNVSITGGYGKDSISLGAITGGTVSVNGGSGGVATDNDTITVASITATTVTSALTSIILDGNAGNDVINVGAVSLMRKNGGGLNPKDTVLITGGLGADFISVASVAGDQANAVNIYGDDVAGFTSGNDTINVGAITGRNVSSSDWGGAHVNIDAGIGDDRVSVTSINAGALYISGGTGADSIYLGGVSVAAAYMTAKVSIDGGADNDTITVGNISGTGVRSGNLPYAGVTIGGGTGNDIINVGNIGNITGNITSVDIQGGADNDTITVGNISGLSTVSIQGGAGDDLITVGDIIGNNTGSNVVGNATGVNIHGELGNDTITVGNISGNGALCAYGHAGVDRITIGNISGNGTLCVYGHEDNDTITVGNISGNSKADIYGGAGNDNITVGNISGGTVVVNGDDGDDIITINTINGTGGHQINGGYGSDTISATSISGSGSVDIYGGGDADSITVGTIGGSGTVWLYGDIGSDTINVGTINTTGSVRLWGDNPGYNLGTGMDHISVGSIVSGNVDIRGDIGEDSIVINSISGGTVTITGDGSIDYYAHDTINIGTISGGTVTINGDGGVAAGNDSISIGTISGASTSVTINGGDGADTIRIGSLASTAKLTVDGGAGSDTLYFGNAGASAGINLTLNSNVSLRQVDVYTTDYADTINATGLNIGAGGIALHTGNGADAITFGNIDGAHLSILSGAGADSITFGNISGAGIAGSINAGDGDDVITFGTVSGTMLTVAGDEGNDRITTGAITGTANLIGGGGNDTITVGSITGASADVTLTGGPGNDTYNLQATGMKATINGAGIPGDDKVNLFGVTGVSGTALANLNSWAGLVFKKDASGNVFMSFAGGGTDTNILTFSNVTGQDTLSFYSGQQGATPGWLFGGDVDLDELYKFVTTNSGFSDNQWHGVSFVANGTNPTSYEANAVKLP